MRLSALLLAVLACAACRTPDKNEPRVAATDSGRGTVSGVNRPAGDSLAITNRNGTVTLGLRGGVVWMALSDSVKRTMDAKLAADSTQSGLGAMIANTVKKSVAGVLQQEATRPLSEIRDARYENGAIVFDYTGKASSAITFETVKIDDEPVLRTFREEDARRFVSEVRRAKGLPPSQ